MKKTKIDNYKKLISLAIVFMFFAISTYAQDSQNKYALVIGNSSYSNGKLLNAVNDAEDTASALKEIGFDVILLSNASQREMRNAIKQFGKQIQNSDIGLFYYSGHGLQSGGINYLLPIDSVLETESDIQYEGINSLDVLNEMEKAKCKTNIVILDACRNNPFVSANRSSSRGLSIMNFSHDIESLIVYSTAANETASDGDGRNSPFTESLIKRIKTENSDILTIFRDITGDVKRATNGKQIPWTNSSLTKPCILNINTNRDFLTENINNNSSVYVDVQTGTLIVSSYSDGDLYIDNKKIASVPEYGISTIKDIDSGVHDIQMIYSDGKIEKKPVTVLPGIKTNIEFVYTKAKTNSNFVFVEGGKFDMGSKSGTLEEKPVHSIELDGFYISKYELSQNEWDEIMGTEYDEIFPNSFQSTNFPVVNISWYEIMVYCNKRSIKEGFVPCYSINFSTNPDDWGKTPDNYYNTSWDNVICIWNANGYRLPTEAEWEYAAKGGNNNFNNKYSGGSQIDNTGWYLNNSNKKIHEIGQKSCNELGLFDMSGNVWEWCWDWYGPYFFFSLKNPHGALSGIARTRRGGSLSSEAYYCHTTTRNYGAPYAKYSNLGVRLVRSNINP